jgi:hypothetical protein
MRKRVATAAAVSVAGLLTVGTAPQASAQSAVGTYWGTIANCNNDSELYVQPRYTNKYGGQSRADGYNVIANTVEAGYIRKVVMREYRSGQAVGSGRVVNYTGTAKRATAVDIPTSYLPWMSNNSFLSAYVEVTSTTSRCGTFINIAQ